MQLPNLQKGIGHLLVLVIVALIVGAILVYFLLSQGVIRLPFYENPFSPSEQPRSREDYKNPFSDYKNPFEQFE